MLREANDSGMMLTMALTRDLYYIISFLDVKSRDNRTLGDNVKWFAERSLNIFASERSDLASSMT